MIFLRGALLTLFVCGLGWAQNAPRPVMVDDTALIRYLLQPELGSDSIPAGQWSMVPSADTSMQLIVLHNGTEVKRLSRDVTTQILAQDPEYFKGQVSPREESWRPALQDPKPNWDWVKTEKLDQIDGPLFQQTEGFDAGYGLGGSRAEYWWIRDYYFVDVAKIYGNFRGAASFTSYTDYMNLQRYIRELYGKNNFSNTSWSLSISWLAFTYKMQSVPWVLPEYFWLEPNPDTLYELAANGQAAQAGGKVINEFQNGIGSSHSSNLAHSFAARLWYFRYSITLDGDMYTGPLQRIGFEDFPAFGSGTFGVYAVGCGGIWAPGFWIRTGSLLDATIPFVDTWNKFSWTPLRFELEYRNTTHFRLEALTQFHIGGK